MPRLKTVRGAEPEGTIGGRQSLEPRPYQFRRRVLRRDDSESKLHTARLAHQLLLDQTRIIHLMSKQSVAPPAPNARRHCQACRDHPDCGPVAVLPRGPRRKTRNSDYPNQEE
jgi:hypothetical protein